MTEPPVVAGVVLAAGAGRRFGQPKALVVLDGERLVDRAVRLLTEGGCAPVIVVSGAAPLEVAGAVVVENRAWRSGMASSLRAGLDAVAGADAVVLITVDTPWLGAEAVRRLRAAYLAGASAAVATYEGQRGHPVLLDRGHFAGVAGYAKGDVGARAFLAAHPEVVTLVPCDGTGSSRDIDTPADLGG